MQLQAPSTKKIGIGDLQRLYIAHNKDVNNEEFLTAIPLFIYTIQRRHMGKVDEDLTSISLLRVIESFDYYDPDKVKNIGSFIYSVVRNQVSSFLYKKKKRDRESDDALPFLAGPEKADERFLRLDEAAQIVGSFSNLEVDYEFGFLESMLSGDSSTYWQREYLWRNIELRLN